MSDFSINSSDCVSKIRHKWYYSCFFAWNSFSCSSACCLQHLLGILYSVRLFPFNFVNSPAVTILFFHFVWFYVSKLKILSIWCKWQHFIFFLHIMRIDFSLFTVPIHHPLFTLFVDKFVKNDIWCNAHENNIINSLMPKWYRLCILYTWCNVSAVKHGLSKTLKMCFCWNLFPKKNEKLFWFSIVTRSLEEPNALSL